MVPKKLILLLVCGLYSYASVADEPPEDDVVTCSVELGMIKARDSYLVAEFEHTQPPLCDSARCTESLTVSRVISAGKLAENLTKIDVHIPLETDAIHHAMIGSKALAVYIPDPKNGAFYALLTESHPADGPMIAVYEASARAAKAANSKAPHCRKVHGQ